MNTEKTELLRYALQGYSHLLQECKTISFKQWAELIRQTYDEKEPHNKAIIDLLQSTIGNLNQDSGRKYFISYL
jgi:hypothetical protein